MGTTKDKETQTPSTETQLPLIERVKQAQKKQEHEANTQVAEEIKAFIRPDFIETTTGHKIPFPKVTWKKEIQIATLIGEVIEAVPEVTEVNWASFSTGDILKLVSAVMKRVPGKITDAACILLDKDEEWVGQNMDSVDLLKLLAPFFLERKHLLEAAFNAM